MSKSIIVVEDDHFDRELIATLLTRNFPDFNVRFFNTEEQFRSGLPAVAQMPPSLVLLDLRMPWTNPAPEMPPCPPDVVAGTYGEAGLRCWKALRGDVATKNVPVIFYTIVDDPPADVMEALKDRHTAFVEKGTDDLPIISAIRQMLRAV